MKRFETSKILFYISCFAWVLALTFLFGLYSGYHKTDVFKVVESLKNNVKHSLKAFTGQFSTLTKTHPSHSLQPARYKGAGVTINDAAADNRDFIFMTGFFDGGIELRLIRRDGSLVNKWPAHYSEIFTDTSYTKVAPMTDWNVDIHGALALPDGSVVFNFEYFGLVKMDQFGKVIWKVSRETHHSVELAEDGGFWAPGRRQIPKGVDSPFPPFEPPFSEDTIMKISPDGEILTELSAPKLFYDNGLETLLTATGDRIEAGMQWDEELLHLNKVVELSSDIADKFPMFEAGDLALSLRKLNMIMVISPKTGEVKWWRIGPWVRQHDPEFNSDGSIVVFNNNTYRTAFGGKDLDKSLLSIPRVSNILALNPMTGAYRIIYGEKKDQEILSVLRGKVELTKKGGLLITEFEGGRVFETDNKGKIILGIH